MNTRSPGPVTDTDCKPAGPGGSGRSGSSERMVGWVSMSRMVFSGRSSVSRSGPSTVRHAPSANWVPSSRHTSPGSPQDPVMGTARPTVPPPEGTTVNVQAESSPWVTRRACVTVAAVAWTI